VRVIVRVRARVRANVRVRLSVRARVRLSVRDRVRVNRTAQEKHALAKERVTVTVLLTDPNKG
jgi:hypothetical protein